MAALRMALLALLLSLAAAAANSSGGWEIGVGVVMEPDGHGLVADAIGMEEEMMMDSESARRQLGGAGYISYGALARNQVPCGRKGRSYYDCRGHEQANPYNRGCTRVTSCARSTV